MQLKTWMNAQQCTPLLSPYKLFPHCMSRQGFFTGVIKTDSSPLNAFGKLSHSDSYLWFFFPALFSKSWNKKKKKKKTPLGNLVSFFPKHTCCTNFNLQANWHGQKKSEGRESCVVKADISLWQGSAFLFPAPVETLQCILKRHHARDDFERRCTDLYRGHVVASEFAEIPWC